MSVSLSGLVKTHPYIRIPLSHAPDYLVPGRQEAWRIQRRGVEDDIPFVSPLMSEHAPVDNLAFVH